MLFAPYHAVVRLILRRAFSDISAGRGAAVAENFSRNAILQFYGDHVLGGEIRGRQAIAGWFERLHQFFPGLRLTPRQIIMNGLPWNTKIAVRFGVDATLPDGSAYHNEGMQYLRIVWGRIIEDRLYEDTDLLRRALLTIESRAALQPDKSTP